MVLNDLIFSALKRRELVNMGFKYDNILMEGK